MRELSFRAWIHLIKRMVPVYDLMSLRDDIVVVSDPTQNSSNFFTVDEAVIMQFTGFKDKNGVEIYEGDIVRFNLWWDGHPEDSVETWEVAWRSLDCKYSVSDACINWRNPEVIGNIYENSELSIGSRT